MTAKARKSAGFPGCVIIKIKYSASAFIGGGNMPEIFR